MYITQSSEKRMGQTCNLAHFLKPFLPYTLASAGFFPHYSISRISCHFLSFIIFKVSPRFRTYTAWKKTARRFKQCLYYTTHTRTYILCHPSSCWRRLSHNYAKIFPGFVFVFSSVAAPSLSIFTCGEMQEANKWHRRWEPSTSFLSHPYP